ncbi:MAG: 2-oxo-4-hydroxy-4-carboxy-5-ureidoimidazoline decarboxylase [Cyanobacteria bacterium P01_A01_bin.135]
MGYSLSEINQFEKAAFVRALGHLFEHTPEIVALTWPRSPFQGKADMHQAMVEVMRSLPAEQQLALIRAHPELGSTAKMANASIQEQASSGFDRLTPAEAAQLRQLNADYYKRFGFPFIIAVKHHTRAEVVAAFQRRLQNNREVEYANALDQIAEIAWLRLSALVTS